MLKEGRLDISPLLSITSHLLIPSHGRTESILSQEGIILLTLSFWEKNPSQLIVLKFKHVFQRSSPYLKSPDITIIMSVTLEQSHPLIPIYTPVSDFFSSRHGRHK